MQDIHELKQKSVEALLAKALDFINTQGKEAAFSEFNKGERFSNSETYVFAEDQQGNLLATSHNRHWIGQNLNHLKDAHGMYLNQALVDKAKQGGGWVSYQFENPKTLNIENKYTLVLPIQDYFIAAGYYLP